jgi:ankyrin repeat protein
LENLKRCLSQDFDKRLLNRSEYNSRGWTALHYACATGNFECALELIRNVTIKNNNGKTPLELLKQTPVTQAILHILLKAAAQTTVSVVPRVENKVGHKEFSTAPNSQADVTTSQALAFEDITLLLAKQNESGGPGVNYTSKLPSFNTAKTGPRSAPSSSITLSTEMGEESSSLPTAPKPTKR